MKLKNLLMILLLAIAGKMFADEKITVPSVTINAGNETSLEVLIDLELAEDPNSQHGESAYSAIQFDIVLPNGTTIQKNSKGNPRILIANNHIDIDEDDEKSHSISSNISETDENSTTYKVVIWSGSNIKLRSGSGAIVKFYLLAEASAEGVLNASVKNIILAASGGSGGIGDNGKTTLVDASFQISVHGSIATVTMNNTGDAYWSTYYNSIENMLAPEGTQVFTVSLSETELTLTEVSNRIIKAGEGVILKKTTTGSIELNKTDAAATESYYTNNCLEGTEFSITNPGDAYVLNYKENIGVGFYKLSAQGTIGAKKAYLIYSRNNARESFGFSSNTTGIESITSDTESSHQVFDLQGRRVINPKSGVYIMNGKKVVIK